MRRRPRWPRAGQLDRRERQRRHRRHQSARVAQAALRREGQARDLSLPSRWTESSGDVRPQARAREVGRQAAAAGVDQGLPLRVHHAELHLARAEVQVRPPRPERRGAQRDRAASREGGGRYRHREVDVHGRLQSRARADHDEHRLADVRPAELRFMGHLRARQRDAGPARVRRLQHRRQRHERRRIELGQRLPAVRLQRHALPQHGRSGALSLEPQGHGRRSAARFAGNDQEAEPEEARLRRRPGDRDAHQLIRDGVQDAIERAGPDGSLEGAEAHPRSLRRGAGQGELRQRVSARAAHDRTRRALRANFPRELGPARRTRRRPEEELQEHRPGQRGARHGPQAARPAGRHARHLGR